MTSQISIITVTHNRPNYLENKALTSLLKQTTHDFKWIVINDGADLKTREVISNFYCKFEVEYREIEHPKTGFGLCKGRNLGLSIATTPLVTYLDDDNCLESSFIEEMIELFDNNQNLKFVIPQQDRKREVWQQGKKIKESKAFISPKIGTGLEELVTHQQLFDSNGFTHRRESAPRWNENYRIYCDYEYFLQCIELWGEEAFKINQKVLVEYIQSNQGVIGQSNLENWVEELESILFGHQSYSVLEENLGYKAKLELIREKYFKKAQEFNIPAAFKV